MLCQMQLLGPGHTPGAPEKKLSHRESIPDLQGCSALDMGLDVDLATGWTRWRREKKLSFLEVGTGSRGQPLPLN
jgi:hypothetical protein